VSRCSFYIYIYIYIYILLLKEHIFNFINPKVYKFQTSDVILNFPRPTTTRNTCISALQWPYKSNNIPTKLKTIRRRTLFTFRWDEVQKQNKHYTCLQVHVILHLYTVGRRGCLHFCDKRPNKADLLRDLDNAESHAYYLFRNLPTACLWSVSS